MRMHEQVDILLEGLERSDRSTQLAEQICCALQRGCLRRLKLWMLLSFTMVGSVLKVREAWKVRHPYIMTLKNWQAHHGHFAKQRRLPPLAGSMHANFATGEQRQTEVCSVNLKRRPRRRRSWACLELHGNLGVRPSGMYAHIDAAKAAQKLGHEQQDRSGIQGSVGLLHLHEA